MSNRLTNCDRARPLIRRVDEGSERACLFYFFFFLWRSTVGTIPLVARSEMAGSEQREELMAVSLSPRLQDPPVRGRIPLGSTATLDTMTTTVERRITTPSSCFAVYCPPRNSTRSSLNDPSSKYRFGPRCSPLHFLI